jgi:hypothetical protein
MRQQQQQQQQRRRQQEEQQISCWLHPMPQRSTAELELNPLLVYVVSQWSILGWLCAELCWRHSHGWKQWQCCWWLLMLLEATNLDSQT